ncbi:MAG: DNA endonuclease SmrA [Pseudomonadota bacterium]|jgi:DNA-nicking Smr family endonuclease|nr:DNA endonuclease SmrA [Pseudomonadota bacterium]MEC8716588.1 DNA endonuclease SmrA [Pseudomonadota bacterium]MED5444886.1 DNA endonuclease SmrA [Pseudomonadota bacterium]
MTSDDALFLAEMDGVAPLAESHLRVRAESPEAPSLAQLARRQAAANTGKDSNTLTLGEVPPVDPFDEIAFKRDGVQTGVYRKLRLGRYPQEATLDLHRMTVREAREAVWRFVHDAQRAGLRSVIITHGRGDRSETPGRLKSYVAHWLPTLSAVLAFHSAQRHHGGYGACYVLLRKNAEKRQDNRERHARRTPLGGR